MKKKPQLKRRNLLHNHPLLFKGGVHKKSNKANRRQTKQSLLNERLLQNLFSQVNFGEAFRLSGLTKFPPNFCMCAKKF